MVQDAALTPETGEMNPKQGERSISIAQSEEQQAPFLRVFMTQHISRSSLI